MGNAAACCSHLVPGEAIKGKDEELLKNIKENNQTNNMVKN